MTTQPEALRMAEMLMMSRHHIDHEAAAELRRLHNLCAEWEKKAATWLASPEAAKKLDGYRELAQRVNTVEAALRQAVEALEKAMGDSVEFGRISYGECLSAITTAKQALGDKS